MGKIVIVIAIVGMCIAIYLGSVKPLSTSTKTMGTQNTTDQNSIAAQIDTIKQ